MDAPESFEWDGDKAASNQAKHKLPFVDAVAVFLDPDRIDYDVSREADGEPRRKVVGRLKMGLVTVVYTLRGEVIRIISARRANAGEERRYDDR